MAQQWLMVYVTIRQHKDATGQVTGQATVQVTGQVTSNVNGDVNGDVNTPVNGYYVIENESKTN